jgi:hypothetical protein
MIHRKYSCRYCNEKCFNKEMMKRHVYNKHEEMLFSTDYQ